MKKETGRNQNYQEANRAACWKPAEKKQARVGIVC
jgi:hypothetical protein